MAFNLSPSVNIIEEDYSNFVSGISSSVGAIVGEFDQGPAEEIITITSSEELVRIFGTPSDTNYADWFTAYNFLNYGRNLKVVRVLDGTASGTYSAENASSSGTAGAIPNSTDLDYPTQVTNTNTFIAKYPGTYGNNIGISLCQYANFDSWLYKSYFDQRPFGDDVYVVVTFTEGNTTSVVETWALSMDQNSKDGFGLNNWIQTGLERSSDYLYAVASQIELARGAAPSATGADGAVLEATPFEFGTAQDFTTATATVVGDQLVISTGPNAGTYDITAVTANSVTLAQPLVPDTAMSFTVQKTLTNSGADNYVTLTGGTDSAAAAVGDYQAGWDLFSDAASVDVSLLMAGGSANIAGGTSMEVPKYILEVIAEGRKDCVAFISPQANIVGSTTLVNDIIADRAFLPSSSYGFMDGNYKMQYDKYNDVFRWVPLNGDIAGLCAQTDETNDPWFSPAGYSRGLVKNVTKLAFTPTKTDRDSLYLENVNAVLTEIGAGTLLYGDKTLQKKASAFDRINVRRLFIVVEKAIANAAKFNLFEFNDEFTRTRFVQSISPFLRDVQSRRGIIEFAIVADETVNTPQVIDSNEFRANILIKPNKSINYINLTFTAVSSGVSFDEILVQ